MLLTYGTAAPNLAKNLAGAGLGRICQNWPDAGPAGAGAKICYMHKINEVNIWR